MNPVMTCPLSCLYILWNWTKCEDSFNQHQDEKTLRFLLYSILVFI